MTVVLDTSFLMALYNTDEREHPRALEILEEVGQGLHGAAFMTDYVIDELMTLAWARTRDPQVVTRLHHRLLGSTASPPGELLFVGESLFGMAAALHRRHHARLSFTDCTTLTVARDNGIESVASFDGAFDGHIERLH